MSGYRTAALEVACFVSNSNRLPRKVASPPRGRRGLLFSPCSRGYFLARCERDALGADFLGDTALISS
jgi:hypothetical protein